MNYSKDMSEYKIFICFWKALKKHIDVVIKGCLFLLLALCLALLITTIIMDSSGIQKIETQNVHTTLEFERKLVKLSGVENISTPCQILRCSIECLNAKHIYEEVFHILHAVDCKDNITLKLKNQRFPNSILTNGWKPANKIIKSLVIENSEFTHIVNEAFNSLDFTATQTVTLLDVKLNTLRNGILLGFASLKSLRIEGRIRRVGRCFFQPVQSSLIRLTLRGDLTISGKSNIFGISFMANLITLDLSKNFINGSLTRSFFRAVPALKYLTLSNSEISSIDEDAFDDIANNLLVLDLSNNRLKTLDVRSLEQVIKESSVNIYLLGNEWLCECELKPLISLYQNYKDYFGDIPYCKSPLSFYGVLLTNLKFVDECKEGTQMTTALNHMKTDLLTVTSSSIETNISFKMACISVIGIGDAQELDVDSTSVEYFLFAPPCHEFELIRFENNSVQVVVQYADEPINIIWFSEAVENFIHTVNNITFDYDCVMYSEPFLIAENLEENCTYTFCLIPSGRFSITPFNCLPLHIPAKLKAKPTTWISHDEKELTLGIVCLIMICALLFGGTIAYFGIKAYPDVLEGSNRVFVVKKSNKSACYVSTITEGEYVIHKNSLKMKNSTTVDLGSLASLSPRSLCKDSDSIKDESFQEREDCYEMPFIYNKTHNCQNKCLYNKYEITPTSPPPLPKRNSDRELVFDMSNSKQIL